MFGQATGSPSDKQITAMRLSSSSAIRIDWSLAIAHLAHCLTEQLRGIQRSDAHHAAGCLAGMPVLQCCRIWQIIGEENRADLPYPEHLEHCQTAGVGTWPEASGVSLDWLGWLSKPTYQLFLNRPPT